jgi:peptidoglycan/LPS O-acetylase OafA/YrhL
MTSSRLPALDGLRAVAVAAVVLGHAVSLGPADAVDRALGSFLPRIHRLAW